MMMNTKQTKIPYSDITEENMNEKGLPQDGQIPLLMNQEDLPIYNEIYNLLQCQTRKDFYDYFLFLRFWE
jgi:hypothetical protein